MSPIYHVTDAGVIELTPFQDATEINRAVLAKAREREGDAWWDGYEARIAVDQQLIAGAMA